LKALWQNRCQRTLIFCNKVKPQIVHLLFDGDNWKVKIGDMMERIKYVDDWKAMIGNMIGRLKFCDMFVVTMLLARWTRMSILCCQQSNYAECLSRADMFGHSVMLEKSTNGAQYSSGINFQGSFERSRCILPILGTHFLSPHSCNTQQLFVPTNALFKYIICDVPVADMSLGNGIGSWNQLIIVALADLVHGMGRIISIGGSRLIKSGLLCFFPASITHFLRPALLSYVSGSRWFCCIFTWLSSEGTLIDDSKFPGRIDHRVPGYKCLSL
jgi:hypothetical protein